VDLVLHEEWLGEDGKLLLAPGPEHAAEQSETGDAAGDGGN